LTTIDEKQITIIKNLKKNANCGKELTKKCRKQFQNRILENNPKTDFGKYNSFQKSTLEK